MAYAHEGAVGSMHLDHIAFLKTFRKSSHSSGKHPRMKPLKRLFLATLKFYCRIIIH